jgi:hypothetical protein
MRSWNHHTTADHPEMIALVLTRGASATTATQPVTVAHLMMSAMLVQGMPPQGTGDPSLGIVPHVEQYRTDYKFLAPVPYLFAGGL